MMSNATSLFSCTALYHVLELTFVSGLAYNATFSFLDLILLRGGRRSSFAISVTYFLHSPLFSPEFCALTLIPPPQKVLNKALSSSFFPSLLSQPSAAAAAASLRMVGDPLHSPLSLSLSPLQNPPHLNLPQREERK